MTGLCVILALAAATALAFLLGVRVRTRELPSAEAAEPGLPCDWVWSATEIGWPGRARIFWVNQVRPRYD